MKKPFYIRMEEQAVAELTKVAKTYDMEPNAYAAMIVARFADLKPEFALDALTAIPKEFFKPRAGRPAARPALTEGHTAQTA